MSNYRTVTLRHALDHCRKGPPMELRHRLLLAISGVFLTSILLISSIVVPQADRILEEHANRYLLAEATRASERIDHWLGGRAAALRMLALQLELSGLAPDDPAVKIQLVNTGIRFGDQFPNLYCGFEDGRLIATRGLALPDGFDPRTRPWYIAARAKRGLVFTEPFAEARTGQLVFSIAYPLSMPVGGVLATDVALSDLAGIAHAAFIHPEAAVMLVSKYGQVLYASEAGVAQAGERLEAIREDGLAAVLAQASIAGQAAGAVTLNGQARHVLATPVASSEWRVLVYLPQMAFAAEKKRLWEQAGLIGLFALSAILFAIYWLVGKITRPLEVIALRARQFKLETHDVAFAPLEGPLEVRHLAESLDAMRTRLLAAFDAQDSLLEETQAQNEEIQALYSQVKAMNETLAGALWEKQRAYLETIKALTDAIEAKDYYTRGHSERVSRYAVALADALGWADERKERLQYAATLHDIGKIGVPREVLNKPGRLTAREYDQVKRHPVVGWRIVDNISHLQDVSQAIRQHHERLDGSGYPDGASGAAICSMARLLAIADAYDAMTSMRPYRPAMSAAEAGEELVRGAGNQFDAALVAVFCAHVIPQIGELAQAAWVGSELSPEGVAETCG